MGIQNGARWRKLRAQARQRDHTRNAPCWICHQPIDYQATRKTSDDAWEPDHYHPRSTHPHLTYEISNLRPSHAKCNQSRQNTPPTQTPWNQAENWT